jgi:bifunctional polynucleotide phosphatase/kinase
MLAMAAVGDDEYRKPCQGMWSFHESTLNGGIKINVPQSKYVGDAAGRPVKGSKKKDFNDTDLKFALNIGIPFATPEMFFLGQTDSWPTIPFNPKALRASGSVFRGQSDNSGMKSGA